MSDNQFDAAALAGTTLAATLAILAEPGPFDWMNGIVGTTLLMIVLGYEIRRRRNPLQSAALAMVIALAALLPVSLGLEWHYGEGDLDGISRPTLVDEKTGEIKEAIIDTAIPDSRIPQAWLGLFLLALLLELTLQWHWRRRASKESIVIDGVGQTLQRAPNPSPAADR